LNRCALGWSNDASVFRGEKKDQNKSKTQWKSKITHFALACHKSKDDEI